MRALVGPLAAVLLFVLSVPAAAGEDPQAHARDLFKKYRLAQGEAAEMRNAAGAETEAAKTEEEKTRAKAVAEKLLREARAHELAARDAFLRCFRDVDWNDWTQAQDAELLEEGLSLTAFLQFRQDPALSVKAFEQLISKLPNCSSGPLVRAVYLPRALASAGDLDAALKRTKELFEASPGEWKPYLFEALSDLRALKGDLAAAREEAARGIQLNALAGLERRSVLLGHAAPELDSKVWLGAEAVKLSALKGKVVIVSFWGSWSWGSMELIPMLDDLYRKRMAEGLVVLGVTRFSRRGYRPASMQDLRDEKREGSVCEIADQGAFEQHLREFRERTRVSFPFVVAQDSDAENFHADVLPSSVVLDGDGKIVFIADGGMREHVLRLAVERLLKAK